MLVALMTIPFFSLLAILLLYPHTAKREFLRFDLIQFVYGFIIFPLMYLWLKSFLYFLIRHQTEFAFSTSDVLILDSVVSVAFLYIFAFVIIHSLTKSFKEKKLRDPLYDMFAHSEWFHMHASHLFIYIGLTIVFTLFSLLNIALPLDIAGGRTLVFSAMTVGFLFGVLAYGGVWLSDIMQGNFMRVLKLTFASSFVLQVLAYFFFDPDLQPAYAVYWTIFPAVTGMVASGFAFDRSERPKTLFERLKHQNWGINIQLWPTKK